TSRICQRAGHSAATVISPSGGITAFSGRISSSASNPQNDGGNRGHTIRIFGSGPSGGHDSTVSSASPPRSASRTIIAVGIVVSKVADREWLRLQRLVCAGVLARIDEPLALDAVLLLVESTVAAVEREQL